MLSLAERTHSFITAPQHHKILSIIKGFRNGAVYGSKVRFPHALVMTFLFREGSLKDKFHIILQATFTHARNLAAYVFIYKGLRAILATLRKSSDAAQTFTGLDPFISGLIGGYFVFGEDNPINNQMILYLLSRITVAFAKVLVKKGVVSNQKKHGFSILAALVWACVMYLFEYEKETLQPSLAASMTYLYSDSEKWNSIRSFLWHNK